MSEGNVAVDVGFGQTKWAVKLDGVIITGGFPSLAPISSGVTVSTNESMGGKRNTVKVVVGNTSFEIGPTHISPKAKPVLVVLCQRNFQQQTTTRHCY
jgi:hypothetical protein